MNKGIVSLLLLLALAGGAVAQPVITKGTGEPPTGPPVVVPVVDPQGVVSAVKQGVRTVQGWFRGKSPEEIQQEQAREAFRMEDLRRWREQQRVSLPVMHQRVEGAAAPAHTPAANLPILGQNPTIPSGVQKLGNLPTLDSFLEQQRATAQPASGPSGEGRGKLGANTTNPASVRTAPGLSPDSKTRNAPPDDTSSGQSPTSVGPPPATAHLGGLLPGPGPAASGKPTMSPEEGVKLKICDALDKRKIPYATEIEFYVLDENGKRMKFVENGKVKWLVGKMDVVYVDPADGKVKFVETKGYAHSGKTNPQKIYHPLLEEGADWEIKGHKGRSIGLAKGVRGSSLSKNGFQIIHSENLGEFLKAVEHISPAQKYSYVRVSADGHREAKYFESLAEYHEFLESIGMTPVERVNRGTPEASAPDQHRPKTSGAATPSSGAAESSTGRMERRLASELGPEGARLPRTSNWAEPARPSPLQFGTVTIEQKVFFVFAYADGVVSILRAEDWREAARIGGTLAATELAASVLTRYAPRAAGILGVLSLVTLAGDSAESIESARLDDAAFDFLEKNVPDAIGTFGPIHWVRDHDAFAKARRLLDNPQRFLDAPSKP
jgi:hypothetical protein